MTDEHQPSLKQPGRRKRPSYPPAYRKDMVKARTRAARRELIGPGVRLCKGDDDQTDGFTWGPAFNGDDDYWWLKLCDAFGTRSDSVVHAFMDQLIQLSGGHRPSPALLNAAIAIIGSYKPANEGEAMLAAQMVAVNTLTMKAAAYANSNGRQYVPDREAKLTFRGARTFAEQADTMARLKGRTRSQRIDVHYHYNPQTVAGDVHVYRGGDGFGGPTRDAKGETQHRDRKYQRQHARSPHPVQAIEHTERPALRGPNPTGLALPGPTSERPRPLSLAWLWQRIGRAARGGERIVPARGVDPGSDYDQATVIDGDARLSPTPKATR